MKNFKIKIAALLFIGSLVACEKTNQEQIEGFKVSIEMDAPDGSWIFLQTRSEMLDSAQFQEGKASIQGDASNPYMAMLGFPDRREVVQIFMENSVISVKGSLDSLEDVLVSGSELHSIWEDYDLASLILRDKQEKMWNAYQKADSAEDQIAMDAIDQQWDDLEAEFESYEKGFVAKNSNNAVAAYIIYSSLKYSLETPELDAITQSLSPELDSLPYVVSLNERIEKLKRVEPGQPIIDFVQNDPEGNPIRSEQFRGKYLLIDFWASWCGPCRRENPNVVQVYSDLKDKGVGFEILGVSFDVNEERWLGAIEDDGLPWPQVSDLKGWENAVGAKYAIQSIPHTVLVDPDGIIVEHKLRGEELRARLEKLLSNS